MKPRALANIPFQTIKPGMISSPIPGSPETLTRRVGDLGLNGCHITEAESCCGQQNTVMYQGRTENKEAVRSATFYTFCRSSN
ncbi:hypothetical protein RRG08_045256 [Elysia crispata]|uniref:Cysteine-rich domain-containing protein n=1 Tax=Elysia crispata TaxID=231223 RepID=A0AAE1A1I2_9GAST|nr:hypothetical protein RRG08_045256 [Elysia crispata]